MKAEYFKSLDGVRFLAVSLVLVEHWSGDAFSIPTGYLGVCMFFVLSGFLITRILLKAKAQDAQLERGHGFSLKQFYIRRTIRIFPIYYLTIFLLAIFNVPPVREKLFWCLTYSTNIYIAIKNTWLGSIDHLWSLAVEEQFYLFFPFVILFAPLKRIPKILVAFIVGAILLRAFFFLNGNSWVVPYVLMPTALDAFGLGGLLAYFAWSKNEKAIAIFSNSYYLLITLLLYLVVVVIVNYLGTANGYNFVIVIFLRFFEALFSVFLIGKLAFQDNNNTFFSKYITPFFTNKLSIYIGKISYGVYIYHNFVFNFYHSSPTHPTVRIWNKLNTHFPIIGDNMYLKIIYLYILVIIVASISWFLIEKPINKLKDKFDY